MRDLSGCAAVSLRPSPDYHGRARMSEFGMHEQEDLVELCTITIPLGLVQLTQPRSSASNFIGLFIIEGERVLDFGMHR